MNIWQEIAISINNAFDLTVIWLSILFAPFSIYRLFSIAKEAKERERKAKEKTDRYNEYWRKEIKSIFSDLSIYEKQQLILNLSKEGDELYLLFRFPHHKLSKNNVLKINEILKVAFKTTSEDRYLYSYFDYWIKDFASDVMLPVLHDKGEIK